MTHRDGFRDLHSLLIIVGTIKFKNIIWSRHVVCVEGIRNDTIFCYFFYISDYLRDGSRCKDNMKDVKE